MAHVGHKGTRKIRQIGTLELLSPQATYRPEPHIHTRGGPTRRLIIVLGVRRLIDVVLVILLGVANLELFFSRSFLICFHLCIGWNGWVYLQRLFIDAMNAATLFAL